MQALASIAAAFTGTATPMQGGSATTAGASSVSFTFASTVTAGSTLVAFAGISGATPSGASAISDTAGNTWILLNDSTETDAECEVAMWYVIGAVGGANTITVTNNAGLSYDLQCWEYPSALSALDVWGGGDNSFTFDTNSQTLYGDGSGSDVLVTTTNDTVLVGVYNPQGSQFEFAVTAAANPAISQSAWIKRNQSRNPTGATSGFYDVPVPANTKLWITASLPAPVCPSGGFSGQQPVRIFDGISGHYAFHPDNGYTTEAQRHPSPCGPFEHYNPATDTWELYTVLVTYGDTITTHSDVYKSTDEGVTWAKVGSSPITPNSLSWAPAAMWGDKLYVLWHQRVSGTGTTAGLFVSTFNMSTDSWVSTTPAASGTNISATGSLFFWEFCVPAEDVFIVFYNTQRPFPPAPESTNIMITRYSGGTWDIATLVASRHVLCGLTLDLSTLTAYLFGENWTEVLDNPPLPRTLQMWTITDFSWPFTVPTPVVVQSNIEIGTWSRAGLYRYPTIGPVTRYRGKLYLPYNHLYWFNGFPYRRNPACYVSTSTGFMSIDLAPYAPQGFTDFEEAGPVTNNVWSLVIGTSLYIFWTQGGSAPARIRFCVSPDGNLPAPTTAFYDLNLNMPASYQAMIVPDETLYSLVWAPSISLLFGARIGIICNLEDPILSGYPQAWFLPLTPAGPIPPPAQLGNRFY